MLCCINKLFEYMKMGVGEKKISLSLLSEMPVPGAPLARLLHFFYFFPSFFGCTTVCMQCTAL